MVNNDKGIYRKIVKRIFDFFISSIAIVLLSPILLILIVIGAFKMKGNPFFFQERPGKNARIFKLIKFRTMSNAKDSHGELLPDSERLNSYGKFLRSSSLDELPELFNIWKGDMSIVGPRPLSVDYLPYYNDVEKRRHSVLPGLTGWAQVNGRNTVNWPERFAFDIEYVDNISFIFDIKILFMTVKKVLSRSDVVTAGTSSIINFDDYRKQEWEREGK